MPQYNNSYRGLLSANTVLADRYQIERLLAKGVSSEVYLVRDSFLDNQRLALKLFDSLVRRDPRASTALQQELLLNRTLRHPNILQLYDAHFGEGAHDFITMEYVDGCTLIEFVTSSKAAPLSVEEAIYVFVEYAAGISYAHQQNTVHRNLSADQAMLSRRGDLRITGCGRPSIVGRRVFNEEYDTGCLQAPEELDEGSVTERSNQYSLGMLLFGLLAGFDAIKNEQGRALVADIRSIRAVPAWLAELVQTCTETNPLRRFDSVEQALLFIEAQADIDSIEAFARESLHKKFQEMRRVTRPTRPSGIQRKRHTSRFQKIPRAFRQK